MKASDSPLVFGRWLRFVAFPFLLLLLSFGPVQAGCDELPQDYPATPLSTFINLYYTQLNPPTIGKSLRGDSRYEWWMGKLDEGEHAIALMANGADSFKGSGYVRGGIFDRIQVEQAPLPWWSGVNVKR
ncbi:hypothetical protein [Thiohalomonas denitrificans]|uniref:hypothetical protein n=1 Tax=Thiohalomonas denitrificans TaxID=415747 RepID=UPI0026F048FB|nr:hypothetical protein [Thiohalomonas denitrificans]